MGEQGTETNIAVMTAELRHIKEAVDRIEQNTAKNVTRTEWEQRNQFVDGRFSAFEKELAARKAPWWSVGALAISAAAFLVVLIPLIAN